jgi:hypothetical protein
MKFSGAFLFFTLAVIGSAQRLACDKFTDVTFCEEDCKCFCQAGAQRPTCSGSGETCLQGDLQKCQACTCQAP